jgi:DnaJ-class molecular chaperone
LVEYEDQKKIAEAKRKKLLETPEARVYIYVKEENNKSKCPTCFGSGRIPSITKNIGYTCSKCRGSGRTVYQPKVTPEQRRTAKEFEKKWHTVKEPDLNFFPRKNKSIYIRVVHGGQIFIIEK